MNCEEAEHFLDAYLDGELEFSRQLELEKHLSECPECQGALEERREFRTFLNATAHSYKAPPELRERVLAIIREEPVPAKPEVRRFPLWRRPWIYAAAVLVIGLPIAWMAFYGNREHRFAAQAVSDYLGALLVDHLCDVVSPDANVVKSYLAAKLNFSPPVVDLAAAGYQMRGGRIDIVQNRRVAALVYRRNKDLITLFMWPATRHQFTGSDQVMSGLRICTWNDANLNFIAVSTLGDAELDRFTDSFRGAISGR
jgi:mycothiol system anti-sigma-R factor